MRVIKVNNSHIIILKCLQNTATRRNCAETWNTFCSSFPNWTTACCVSCAASWPAWHHFSKRAGTSGRWPPSSDQTSSSKTNCHNHCSFANNPRFQMKPNLQANFFQIQTCFPSFFYCVSLFLRKWWWWIRCQYRMLNFKCRYCSFMPIVVYCYLIVLHCAKYL